MRMSAHGCLYLKNMIICKYVIYIYIYIYTSVYIECRLDNSCLCSLTSMIMHYIYYAYVRGYMYDTCIRFGFGAQVGITT